MSEINKDAEKKEKLQKELEIENILAETHEMADREKMKKTARRYAVKPKVTEIFSNTDQKPRLINAMGIIKARKKPLTIWSNEDLSLPPEAIGLAGSPTQPGALFSPDLRRGAASLGSELETAADKILELVQKAGV